jgi:hypothetical protein
MIIVDSIKAIICIGLPRRLSMNSGSEPGVNAEPVSATCKSSSAVGMKYRAGRHDDLPCARPIA